jgi:hypothetical protein
MDEWRMTISGHTEISHEALVGPRVDNPLREKRVRKSGIWFGQASSGLRARMVSDLNACESDTYSMYPLVSSDNFIEINQ